MLNKSLQSYKQLYFINDGISFITQFLSNVSQELGALPFQNNI